MSTNMLLPCGPPQKAFANQLRQQDSVKISDRHMSARPVQCEAATARKAGAPFNLQRMLLVKAVEVLFSIKPLFDRECVKARQKIIDRATTIGLDFEEEVARLSDDSIDWPTRLAAATDPNVAMPSYYTQPFHAYTDGNLCWAAAQEFEVASRAVHSKVYDPDPAGKVCEPDADDRFRAQYMDIAKRFMAEGGARPVEAAVDLGCATGLSSDHVRRAFPGCRVTGLDLSPHMIAVGRYLQEQRMSELNGEHPLEFVHANAEATGLPDESQDLVTLCLVAHELPQSATASIFREAFRLLRPGGTLAIMEMDPASEAWLRIFNIPPAFVAFKATEPWLMEYVSLDMPAAMMEAGFQTPRQDTNSLRHKTVVAMKPRQ